MSALDDFTLFVPLTQGYWAEIDPEDAPHVYRHKWHAKVTRRGVVYAGTNLKRSPKGYKWTALHRFVAAPAAGLEVDHRDGDGLNNTRRNLRVCTHKQNMANRRGFGRSRHLGVSQHGEGWSVTCGSRYIGKFYNEDDAGRAYDRAARAAYGEFARLNFPTEEN